MLSEVTEPRALGHNNKHVRVFGSKSPLGQAGPVLVWSSWEKPEPGLQKWNAAWHLDKNVNSVVGKHLVVSFTKGQMTTVLLFALLLLNRLR